MLVRAATRTAPCEFAVNNDRGHAADPVVPRLGCYFRLLHVVNHDLMRRTGYLLDELDCLLAR